MLRNTLRTVGSVSVTWAIPAVMTLIASALFLNGSFFSTYSSLHVDFSINFVAAHALLDGADPYGFTTLAERAADLNSPTTFLYSQLFTSYIQPPTSALSLAPLTALPWREATRVYLIVNHLFLMLATGISLYAVRPQMRPQWVLAGTALILAGFSQIYGSFSLGQVDATILFLLAVSFWAYSRRLAPIAGGCVAIAAAIKLIPALLLLYFVWKRDYAAAMWGAGVGIVLLLLSLLVAGPDAYRTYLTETLPALLNGSTHFTNASLGGAIARLTTDGSVSGVPEIYSLGEVPSDNLARASRLVIGVGALAMLALVIPRERAPGWRLDQPQRMMSEFYLVVAVGLTISSVTWEFYTIWLLPVFLAAFLTPRTFLPRGALFMPLLAGFVVSFVALNYPGDCGQSPQCYLFEPNGVFYHPEWVSGVWVENIVGLYEHHLDAVLYVRLSALLLLCSLLILLVRLNRRTETEREVLPSDLTGDGRSTDEAPVSAGH